MPKNEKQGQTVPGTDEGSDKNKSAAQAGVTNEPKQSVAPAGVTNGQKQPVAQAGGLDEFDKALEYLNAPSTPTATPSTTTATPGATTATPSATTATPSISEINNHNIDVMIGALKELNVDVPKGEEGVLKGTMKGWKRADARRGRAASAPTISTSRSTEANKKEEARKAASDRKMEARRASLAAYKEEDKRKKSRFRSLFGNRRKSAPADSSVSNSSQVDELEWRSFNTWVLGLTSDLRSLSISFNQIVSKKEKKFEVEPLKDDGIYNSCNPVYVIHYFKDFWDKIKGFCEAEKVELEPGEVSDFISTIENEEWEEYGWENPEFSANPKDKEPKLDKNNKVIKAFEGWLGIIKKNVTNLQDKIGKENIEKYEGIDDESVNDLWQDYGRYIEEYNEFVKDQNRLVDEQKKGKILSTLIDANDRKSREIRERIVNPIFSNGEFENLTPADLLKNFSDKKAPECKERGQLVGKYERLKAILYDAEMIEGAGGLCKCLYDFHKEVSSGSKISPIAKVLNQRTQNIREHFVDPSKAGKLVRSFTELLRAIKDSIDKLERVYNNVQKARLNNESIVGKDYDFIFGRDENNCWHVYQNENRNGNRIEKKIGSIAEVYGKVVEKDGKREKNVFLKDPNGKVTLYDKAFIYGRLSDFLRGSVGYLSFENNFTPNGEIECHYTDEEGKENFIKFNANGMAIEINHQGKKTKVDESSSAFKQLKQAFEGNQPSSISPQDDLDINNNNEKNEGGINMAGNETENKVETNIKMKTKKFNELVSDYEKFVNKHNEFVSSNSFDSDKTFVCLEDGLSNIWKGEIKSAPLNKFEDSEVDTETLFKKYVEVENFFMSYISSKTKELYEKQFEALKEFIASKDAAKKNTKETEKKTTEEAAKEDAKNTNIRETVDPSVLESNEKQARKALQAMLEELKQTLKKMQGEVNGGSSIFKKGINAVFDVFRNLIGKGGESGVENLTENKAALANTVKNAGFSLSVQESEKAADSIIENAESIKTLGDMKDVVLGEGSFDQASKNVGEANKNENTEQKEEKKTTETVEAPKSGEVAKRAEAGEKSDPQLEEAKKQLRDFVEKYNGFLSLRGNFAKKYGKTEKDKKIFNESILKNYRVDWWDKFKKYELRDLSDIDLVKAQWGLVLADLIGKYLPIGEHNTATGKIDDMGTRFKSAEDKLKILGEYHTEAKKLLKKVTGTLEKLEDFSILIPGIKDGDNLGSVDTEEDEKFRNEKLKEIDSYVRECGDFTSRHSGFLEKGKEKCEKIINNTMNETEFNKETWKKKPAEINWIDGSDGNQFDNLLRKYRCVARLLINYFKEGSSEYKEYEEIINGSNNPHFGSGETRVKQLLFLSGAVRSLGRMLSTLNGELAKLEQAAANGGQEANGSVNEANENEEVKQKEEGEAAKVVEAPESEGGAKPAETSEKTTESEGTAQGTNKNVTNTNETENDEQKEETTETVDEEEKELLVSDLGVQAKDHVIKAIKRYNRFVRDYNKFVGKFKEENNLKELIEKVTKLKEGPNKKIIWLHGDMRSLTSVSGKTFNTIEELNEAWVDLINKLMEYLPEANKAAYTGKATKISGTINNVKGIDNLEKLKLMEKYNKMCEKMLNYTNSVLKRLEKEAEYKDYLKDATLGKISLEEFAEKYNELLSHGRKIVQTSGNKLAIGGEWLLQFSEEYQLQVGDERDMSVRWSKALHYLIDEFLPEGDVQEIFKDKLSDIENRKVSGNSVNKSEVLKEYRKLGEELYDETENELDRLKKAAANGGETNVNKNAGQKEETKATTEENKGFFDKVKGKASKLVRKGKKVVAHKLDNSEKELDAAQKELKVLDESTGRFVKQGVMDQPEYAAFKAVGQIIVTKGDNFGKIFDKLKEGPSSAKSLRSKLKVMITDNNIDKWKLEDGKEFEAKVGVLYIGIAYLPSGSKGIEAACKGMSVGGIKENNMDEVYDVNYAMKKACRDGTVGHALVKKVKDKLKKLVKEGQISKIENKFSTLLKLKRKAAKLGRYAKTTVKHAGEKIGKSSVGQTVKGAAGTAGSAIKSAASSAVGAVTSLPGKFKKSKSESTDNTVNQTSAPAESTESVRNAKNKKKGFLKSFRSKLPSFGKKSKKNETTDDEENE